MKVPPLEQLDRAGAAGWAREDYPHFHVFCIMTLGRPIKQPGGHYENAKVLAALTDEEVTTIDFNGLVAKGFVE